MIAKQKGAKLPDGVQIEYDALDNVSKNDFDLVKKDYEVQMKGEIDKFSPTLKQIEQKMSSEKYKS